MRFGKAIGNLIFLGYIYTLKNDHGFRHIIFMGSKLIPILLILMGNYCCCTNDANVTSADLKYPLQKKINLLLLLNVYSAQNLCQAAWAQISHIELGYSATEFVAYKLQIHGKIQRVCLRFLP